MGLGVSTETPFVTELLYWHKESGGKLKKISDFVPKTQKEWVRVVSKKPKIVIDLIIRRKKNRKEKKWTTVEEGKQRNNLVKMYMYMCNFLSLKPQLI